MSDICCPGFLKETDSCDRANILIGRNKIRWKSTSFCVRQAILICVQFQRIVRQIRSDMQQHISD